MESAPLFIIGTERSGSNLLRLILNSHSGIAVPHPPHILKFFSPLEEKYGDLSQPDKLRELVDDILGLLAVHVYPWEMHPDSEEIIAGAHPSDVMGVFFGLYNAYLRQSGKRRWGCKSTFMIHHMERVLAVCPSAKFLFLVRDPRDVAVSSRKSIFSPFHPYFTALLWRQQQLEGLRFYDSAQTDSCHIVRYEDLIENPADTVAKICDFLEEDYEQSMLEFYRTKSAQKSESLSGSWKNTASPVLSGNSNRYVTGLSPVEIRLVEEVTGDLMVRFGYTISSTEIASRLAKTMGEDSLLSKPATPLLWLYKIMNFYWALLIEIHSFRKDNNYRQFWSRRIFFLRLRMRFFFRPNHSGTE